MEHLSVTGGLFLPSSKLPIASMGLYTRGREIDGVEGLAYLTIKPETLRHEGLLNIRAFFNRTSLEVAQQGTSGWTVSIQGILDALRTGNLDVDFARHLRNVIDNTDEVAIRSYETFFHKPEGVFTLFYQIANAPDPDSRVTLIDERDGLGMPRVQLDWRFGNLERQTLQRANEILGEELGRSGLGRVSTVPDDPDTGWPPGPRGAWHQMGTTRMHPDPKQGVVDENGRVHGISNLYIAGSSIFPTCGYTNPTLTIVALSLRLSDHVSRLMS
jgi:hypothetical protein